MSASIRITDELDSKGVPYLESHHERLAFTAQQLAEVEHMSGHRVAKVVFAMAAGKPIELVLPASRRVDMGRLRRFLGTDQVRLAEEREMARFATGFEMGAAPPLRLWREVAVIMDESMRVSGDILFQGGTHQDAIRMPFGDWFRMVRPEVAVFAA